LIEALEYEDGVVAASLSGVTLVAPRHVPQHVRLDPALPRDAALRDWLGRAAALGRIVRPLDTAAPAPAITVAPRAAFASIVMLSWNAPDFTEAAVASIARHTPLPHETIVVDNGSDDETRRRLAKLTGVRVHYNERNLGFALGSNQGAALARGTHVVWLNNDVLVTDGWLDALLGLQRLRPTVGISVPVSNNVHGHQQVAGAPTDPAAVPAFAAERSGRLRGRWYRADVAMGLCMCVAREVLDEVGGMDPRYAVGNFEDVDYCVRARAAGYEIGVCEDAFVHHFGSVSFRANRVDYDGQSHANFRQFVDRWNVRSDLPLSEAVLAPIRRGFDRATDAVPLPSMTP
jgi:GT2 family glycosyltransferase